MKKVAFIITVYRNDKLEFFKEAFESIVNQDYGFENINIYLGIDGEIPDEIRGYIDDHKEYFYKIVQNEKNQGLAYTLNRLIEMLEDEKYIFRMDSDDICKLDRVTKQIQYMESNPDIEISGGSIEEIDECGNVKMTRKYPKDTEQAKKYIPLGSIFAHPTVCFRRSFFDKGIKYPANLKVSQDIYLWYQAILSGVNVGNIDDVILSYRISNNFYKRRSYSKAFREFRIYWDGILKLYGVNYRLIYPILRLISRLMPSSIVKIIYSKNIRNVLNKH